RNLVDRLAIVVLIVELNVGVDVFRARVAQLDDLQFGALVGDRRIRLLGFQNRCVGGGFSLLLFSFGIGCGLVLILGILAAALAGVGSGGCGVRSAFFGFAALGVFACVGQTFELLLFFVSLLL